MLEVFIIMLLAGVVAGLNQMPMMDPLNFRAHFYNHGIGSKIFDLLALLGVIASVYISIIIFKQVSIVKFILAYIIWGGIGFGIGGYLIKSRFGGILPQISNIAIISIALYNLR